MSFWEKAALVIMLLGFTSYLEGVIKEAPRSEDVGLLLAIVASIAFLFL